MQKTKKTVDKGFLTLNEKKQNSSTSTSEKDENVYLLGFT